MKNLKNIMVAIGLILFMILSIVLFVFLCINGFKFAKALAEQIRENNITIYEMPDGANCTYMYSSHTKAKFSECSSGLIYLNPKTYRIIDEK